jgi:succinoglycan biosynthesis protein ExoA
VIRKHRLPASPRHLVPFAFVALIGLLALATPWSALAAWALAGLLLSYAGVSLLNGLLTAPRQALGIALATACMQLGYGLGFARGLLDMAVLGRGPGAAMTRLTR